MTECEAMIAAIYASRVHAERSEDLATFGNRDNSEPLATPTIQEVLRQFALGGFPRTLRT